MSNPSRRTLPLAAPPAVTEPSEPQVRLRLIPGADAGLPEPPVARVEPRESVVHGDLRIDEYHWLRDRDDPAVKAYLEAENRYTASMMGHTEALQEQLYQELRGRIKQTDLSVPERLDDFLYYSRTEEGRQYPIHCRRRSSPDAPEEILLDENPLAEGHPYFRTGVIEVSPDHRLLAYSVDTTGAEDFTLYVKDLGTGELFPERIGNTSTGVAWANDSRTLFYAVLDETRRPYRLYRHQVGTNPDTDVLLYEETDGSFFLDVTRSRSRQYLLLELTSHSTSEVRFLPADRPDEPFRLIRERKRGVEYTVTHWGDRFFITTNDGAPNFRLMQAPVAEPGNWSPVLPYCPEIKLDMAEAFRGHLAVFERDAGLRQVRILDLTTGEQHRIAFPEPVYTVWPHDNPEFDTTLLRFSYTSLVTPSSVVEYDMATREWLVRKQTEVLGGYEPVRYRSERLFARAPDGVRVPISLVYRLPLERNGRRPLFLSAYGAYGVSFEPAFSTNTLSLLDRGFVVAIAHVRGGEELGRSWYETGKLLHKRNTFTDFIAAAEHLVREGYTAPERLAVSGASAGGLLMGAVANMRPDLFRVVLAEVPFVDVVNTMLDASLPLTVIEYDEWGNPNDPEFYRYIRSYSPYDNIEPKDYPHIMVTAGLNDPRVAYWEPAKYTARLRATKTDQNRLLLKTNMGAGHGGASGRYDFLREVAFRYAFVLDAMGME